jgi:hypothetical protein
VTPAVLRAALLKRHLAAADMDAMPLMTKYGGTPRRGRVVVVALTLVAALPGVAVALPEEQVRTGRYGFEKGQRTTDGAIFFRVRGSGRDKRVSELVYRNSCLTHNARSPVMRVTRDGRFSRTYSHSNATVRVSVRGRWLTPRRVRGTLVINELGCETRLTFDARRR